MIKTIIGTSALMLVAAAAPGCGGSVRIGTDPETAAQQQRSEDAEIPTAGIDRQTETVPLMTVDIERAPDEPVEASEDGDLPDNSH